MTEKTPPPLDPRFSPAFQRGFDPEDPDATNSVAAPPSALQSRPAQAYSRQVEQSPYAPPTTAGSYSLPEVSSLAGAPAAPLGPPSVTPGSAESAQAAQAAQSAVVMTPGSSIAEPTASVRNPYLIALGVIAVLLVAVGGWLFTRSSAAFDDPGNIASQGQYMSLQAAITVAPIFMLLGAATAIGVLFVFALRWRGKQE